MKKTQRLPGSFIACGIALAIVSSLNAQTTQGKATVVRIKGSARCAVGNSGWKPLQVGDVLKPGTVVQTGLDQGSSVDLVLNDEAASTQPAVFNPAAAMASTSGYSGKAEQNIIRLMENTAVGIDKLTSMNTGADVVTDTQLDLKQGRLLGNVKKMSAASKYEIKLPNGVAGVRGTAAYDVRADGVVRVFAGSVVVAYVGADGNVNTQVTGANQQFDARTGQVTPLAANAKDEFLEFAMVSQRVGGPVSTLLAFDHTIYHVSPRKGKGPPFVPPGPPPGEPWPPGPPD